MKKLLSLLLVFILSLCCFSCKKEINYAEVGRKYIDLLKNYEIKDKDINNNTDNPEFKALLDEMFIDSLSDNYLNLHFLVEDYKSLNITKPEVTLGEFKYSREPDLTDLEKDIEKIKSFDFNSLSYQQQCDYEILLYSYYESAAALCYDYYTTPYSSGTDLANNLITNFYEFDFRSKEDIDDYLVLLADVDRYLEDSLVYVADQDKDGIYTSDYGLNYTIDFINEYISKVDDNALILTFANKISKFEDLSETEKENYQKQNDEIVKNEIIPVFTKVATTLKDYLGKVKTGDLALCNLNKDYAELTYILSCSDNREIDKIFNETKKNTREIVLSYSLPSNLKDEYNAYINGNYPEESPLNFDSFYDTLDYLYEQAKEYYPDLGDIPFIAEELDATVASENTVAYYLSSPIDNPFKNVIRTNPNVMGNDSLMTYSTLAHEGLPGHMYQNYYETTHLSHPIMRLQNFSAYTEGWAVQAQIDSYSWLNISNQKIADVLFFNEYYYFPLYSVADIGINYYGWKTSDVKKYFNDLGIFKLNDKDANEIIDFLTDMPGVYCTYGVGYTNFKTLRSDTQKELGDKFDLKSYNDVLLSNGTVPFIVVRKAVSNYITSKK